MLEWSLKQPDLCLQPAGGNTEQVVSRTPRTPLLVRSRKTCTTVQKTVQQCVREADRHRTKITLRKHVLLLSLKVVFQTRFSFEFRKPRVTRQVVVVHDISETCRQQGKGNAMQAENL